MDRPKLAISACLLGQKVRYDGGHKRDRFLTDTIGKFVDWVPICPELELGMGVPREPVRLTGNAAHPRMIAERSGKDWTAEMIRYASGRVKFIRNLGLSGYIFKKNSPSCGLDRVRVYNAHGAPSRLGRGLFAATVTAENPLLPVEEEGRLNDPALRENFVERVFAYHRWQNLCSGRKSAGALVQFHTCHKFLLLAHSERHYRRLGPIVAMAKRVGLAASYEEYGRLFMEALAAGADVKKHVNVLAHAMGYFSDRLSRDERQELLDVLHDFRRRILPLIVPITLVRHYVNKFDVTYLRGQVYLEPNPKELMLRNHA